MNFAFRQILSRSGKKLLQSLIIALLSVPAYCQQSPAEYRQYFISHYGLNGWKYDSTQKAAKRHTDSLLLMQRLAAKRKQDKADSLAETPARKRQAAIRAMELNMGLLNPAGQRMMRASPEYKKLMGTSNGVTDVCVCMGPGAYVYHEDIACRALSFCKGGIKPMKAIQAQKLGRRSCSLCSR